MDFDLDVGCQGGIYVVRVCGDVDILTAPLLDSCLERLIAAGNTEIAVDLESCSYFDSEGIKILIKALHAVEARGRVVICGARGMVLRIFEVSGLQTLFSILPSTDDLQIIEDTAPDSCVEGPPNRGLQNPR